MQQNFGDNQNPIYPAGIRNVQPRLPFLYSELKHRAQEVLDPRTFSYVAGGAGDGLTQTKNAEAFFRYGITPRMLRDRTQRDLWRAWTDDEFAQLLASDPVAVLEDLGGGRSIRGLPRHPCPAAEHAVLRHTSSYALR